MKRAVFLVSWGLGKILFLKKLDIICSKSTLESFEKEEIKGKNVGFLMVGGSENIA